ncbi:MAG: ABC transporter permease [bacterium]
MFKNYVKITLRNIQRQKGYSFITIAGLSIGLACCIIIFMYVSHELSYDSYHKDADRIYRIPTIVKSGSTEKPFARGLTPSIPEIRNNYREVETAVRFHYLSTANVRVEYDNQVFVEESFMVTDSELFNLFTIPFLLGDPATALERPNTIVITNEIAAKIFRKDNPLGKTLKVNGGDYEITGVIKNAPENTHLTYDIILSLKTVETRMNLDNWGWTGFYSYVKLYPNVNPQVFEKKIRKLAHNYIGKELDELGIEFILFLQPLKDIHLHSNVHREIKTPGDSLYITIFSVVGILVLIVACINFMNLTTARSRKRAKEIGVRKVMGAHRRQLINQFVGEFFFMTLIALLMAIGIINVILPYFNELTGKDFLLSSILQPAIIKGIIGLILFVGIVAGSYPAFFLSAFKPVRIFQGLSTTGSGGSRVRKMLVVWQFAISISLIIGTLLIYRQIDYMKNKHLGFEKDQKLILPVYRGENFEAIKREFLNHPSITGATASSSIPGRISNSLVTKLVGDENKQGWTILYNFVDYDFISEYGIELIAGRPFQREMTTDVSVAFIMNEAAVENFGFGSPEEALGKQITRGGDAGNIIGVVKNFHIKGLQSEIQPHILQLTTSRLSTLSLTLNTENMNETLAFIENKWKELQLGNTFSYFFLDEDFDRQYGSEERMGKLFSILTVLGIIIAILGLFGLASFVAEQRTKEIGIRKVLGASVSGIVVLISKEFTKWVLLANIIAWPVTYFFVNNWLQNFAYRMNIALWVFVLSAALALAIALLTVGFQAVKAAFANPIDSLRYE